MTRLSRISFIGAGNLAWHLAPALENCGHAVTEVFSRDQKNARSLIQRLYNSSLKTTLDFSGSTSHYFFICVSDDAIEEVVKDIVLPEKAVLMHTSGTVSMETLFYSAASEYGVFYPLQTFSKDQIVDFRQIPILIESSDKKTREKLMAIGRELSKKVVSANSEDRKTIHLAAVIACNFTNHLLTRSKEILEENNFEFDLIKPLIAESLNKGLKIGPEKSQTGPAIRNDFKTLDLHLQLLEDEKMREIYKLISQDIIDQYS